jgi:hypothetical protein
VKFRYKALQRMRQPDDLDAPTLLASPRGWIATFVVLFTTAGVCVWGFAGEIPLTLAGNGLLTRPAGTAQLHSPHAGLISAMLVGPAEQVIEGQEVATVEQSDGTTVSIESPFSGLVVSTSVADGHVVGVGDAVLAVERAGPADDRLVAMLFIAADQAVGVVPGRLVDLSVASAPAGAYGMLLGRVAHVSAYPLTAEAVAGLVGGPAAAAEYTKGGPPKHVIVELIPDSRTASGYAWTTRAGPPGPLQTQVKVTATIILGGRSPISLLLGR